MITVQLSDVERGRELIDRTVDDIHHLLEGTDPLARLRALDLLDQLKALDGGVMPTEFAPAPKPLDNGFIANHAYRVLGVFNPSETSEAYVILSNERDEMWLVSNRHVRTAGIKVDGSFRCPLEDLSSHSKAVWDQSPIPINSMIAK